MVTRKSKAEIARMRAAGRIVAEVLALVEESSSPASPPRHLDRIAEEHIRAAGATPSFMGYLGGRRTTPATRTLTRPASASRIDDEIVHGIPGDRTIRAGQIVSVDVGAIVDGWHGDGARTFIYGGDAASARCASLIEATRLAA